MLIILDNNRGKGNNGGKQGKMAKIAKMAKMGKMGNKNNLIFYQKKKNIGRIPL